MPESGPRLLIVDDDRDFADSLVEMLELAGYEVAVAYSGEQALQMCGDTRFDLALMDVRMPGRDGVESFLEIRKSIPGFRAIMMTGYSVPEHLEHALASGVRAVVQKPLNADALLELVDRHRGRGPVLVVDDDLDFLTALCATLEDAGYSTTVARDGDEALDRIDADRPAIVILDLRLPGRSGLDVFLEMQRRNPGIPAVVVSAYLADDAEAVRELRARSVAGVFGKPFDSGDLLRTVDTLSRRAQGPQ